MNLLLILLPDVNLRLTGNSATLVLGRRSSRTAGFSGGRRFFIFWLAVSVFFFILVFVADAVAVLFDLFGRGCLSSLGGRS